MKILLDTNFLMTCARQKIDFSSLTDELIDEGIEWIVPQDVLNELGNLKDRCGMRIADKEAATLCFDILSDLKPKVIELPGKNPNVDIKIVNHIIDKPITLATLDKNLKSRINNKILTIRGKNNLELI
jgi:rRNA-processing protein FCF1